MLIRRLRLLVALLAVVTLTGLSVGSAAAAAENVPEQIGPAKPGASQDAGEPTEAEVSGQSATERRLQALEVWKARSEARNEKRLDILEEWKEKIEKLPVLTDKVNVGLNALQWLYTHQDAHVAEGKSQDNISIRRSELIFWGKISDYIPRWHTLYEMQSISLQNQTPGCAAGSSCATQPTGPAASATFFRESYIDFRPVLAAAPNLNFFRMGIFRMPFGIFTETSGGLRDVISSPYLTTVGSGQAKTATGSGGTIDFLQERDFFIDARGRIANRLEYVAGVMNNNNFTANSSLGANSPKAVYSRVRAFITDVSWVSFTVIEGESNNDNTSINGRGKGAFDRYGADFRYTSKFLPGLMVQGEYWQGHDGANQTTVGQPAQGACLNPAQCGGDGAPGVMRRTWYAYGKYLFTNGLLENLEPIVMYDYFDPNTRVTNNLYTRLTLGLTYYFENLPPKIQSKVQINYEFRHHEGNGPGVVVDPTRGVGDPFAQNVLLIQWQVRYM